MNDPQERQQRILDLLSRQERAFVPELSELLGVSPSTIRTDLRQMEELGQVRRVHGGVTLAPAEGLLPAYAARLEICAHEKRQMAQAAAALVGDHNTIGLDGSSTAYYLARCLAGRDLAVVTNGIYSAILLASYPPTRVFLIGGEMWLASGCTIGHTGRTMLGRTQAENGEPAAAGLRIRQFFTSPGGLTVADGLMDTDPDENLIKQDMIALADEVVVLADHTKLGHRALAPYAPLSAIDWLVTDEQADPIYLRRLEEAGLRTIVAGGPEPIAGRSPAASPVRRPLAAVQPPGRRQWARGR